MRTAVWPCNLISFTKILCPLVSETLLYDSLGFAYKGLLSCGPSVVSESQSVFTCSHDVTEHQPVSLK